MHLRELLRNRITRNASWIMIGRILHMLLSFLIGLLTARYLGPSNYGLINYAAAYTTFFTAFCTLGINSIIVKNFIDHPDEEGETIGTALSLRMMSSALSIAVIIGIVRITEGNEPVTLTVVALYSLCLLVNIFDTIGCWLQSKLLSKYQAIATLVAYPIVSLYKIWLLSTGKSVQWFAVSNSFDYCIVALLLLIFYKRNNGPVFTFSVAKAKELLSTSCSYILPGLMVAIYGTTDKLMIKQLLNEDDVGYYSLAVSVSTIWAFVLSAIIDSMKPVIMSFHNTDKVKYTRMNKQMYALVFYISIAASVAICLIAPLLIPIFYGKEYLPSVQPLRIVVWYVAFSYLGIARDTWVVCERKQKYLKYLYIGSALLNVLLNSLLIPRFGASGAAFASSCTQISTVFLFPLFIKDFAPNSKMIMEAIALRGVLPKRYKEK